MDEINEAFTIDFATLKQRIAEAVRTVIQERADELGISCEACCKQFSRTTSAGKSDDG